MQATSLPIIQHVHSNSVEGSFELLTRDLNKVVEVIPRGDRFVEYGFRDLQWLRGFGLVETRPPRLHDSIWGDRLEAYLAGKKLILFDIHDVPGGTSFIRYRVA